VNEIRERDADDSLVSDDRTLSTPEAIEAPANMPATRRKSRRFIGLNVRFYRRFSASSSASVRGQSDPSSRDKLRSASTFPRVWQLAQ